MCGSTFSNPALLIVSFLVAIQKGGFQVPGVWHRECELGTPATYKAPFSKAVFYPCDVLLKLGDSGHIVPLGLKEHGHYDKSVMMSWFLHTENPKKELIVLCPTYLDITNGDYLLFHEIFNVVGDELRTPNPVPEPIYHHTGLIPEERDDIVELMSLPCQVFETGMVMIAFQTLATTESLTGWDIIYFARSAIKNRPQEGMRVEVSSTVQQIAIPEDVEEFTWEVDQGERIWIQVVHMDLTTNVSEILHTGECSTNPSRVEIYERNCSTNSCMLALLCRNPFNMTPVTLVTEGNFAHVRMFCNQPPGKDCATINYKLYEPEEDIGSCPNANDTATNQTYDPLAGDQFSNLTHSYDQESTSNGTTKVWRLENINHNETAITVEENLMSLSPDCSSERVSIYSGPCIRPENLVTYFCGGMTDTYKLTTSKYTTVVFNGRRSPTSGMSFKIVINAGPQPPPPPPLVIIIVSDDVESFGEQPLDTMVIVVGVALILTILVIIPAVITFVKKAIRPSPAVMPTEPSLVPDIDLATMAASFTMYRESQTIISPLGIDDLPPPYPGSVAGVSAPFTAPLEATLGIPQFPRQPSAVSLDSTKVTPIPSIASFGEPEMHFSIAPSPTLSFSEGSESSTESIQYSLNSSDNSISNQSVSLSAEYQPDEDLSSTKSDFPIQAPVQVPWIQSPDQRSSPVMVSAEKEAPQAASAIIESPVKESHMMEAASSEATEERHTVLAAIPDQDLEATPRTQECVADESDTDMSLALESSKVPSQEVNPQAVEPQSVQISSTVSITEDVPITREAALPYVEAPIQISVKTPISSEQETGQMPLETPLSVSSTSVPILEEEVLNKGSASDAIPIEEPSVPAAAPVPISVEEHLVSEQALASVPISIAEPSEPTLAPVRILIQKPSAQEIAPVPISVEEPLVSEPVAVPTTIEEPIVLEPAPVPIPVDEPLVQEPPPVPILVEEPVVSGQAPVPIPIEEPIVQEAGPVPIPIQEPLVPAPAPALSPIDEPLVTEQAPVPVTTEPVFPLPEQEVPSIESHLMESIISPIPTEISTTQEDILSQTGVPESEVEAVKKVPPFSRHVPQVGSGTIAEQSQSIGPSMSGLGQLPSLGTEEPDANLENAEAAGVTEITGQPKGKKKRRRSSIKGTDVVKVAKGKKGKKKKK